MLSQLLWGAHLQQAGPALSAGLPLCRSFAKAAAAAAGARSRSRGQAGEPKAAGSEGAAPTPQAAAAAAAAGAAAQAATRQRPLSSSKAAVAAAAAAAAAAPLLNEEAEHKHKALDNTMKLLNKRLGSGTLMRLGDQAAARHGTFECVPSGCLTLDVALGGGWARGRIVEVFGPESSGKTTLALHAIAQVQKAGGMAMFVDAEHAFNKSFAAQLGVDVENLLFCQPSCGEDALEVVDHVLRSHAVDLVAVDSVSALLPRAELEGAIGDMQIASQARLMSSGLRKLASNAAKTRCTVMFINQLRHKVGVLFGSPETTSGGQALKFYASQRVDVRVREKVKDSSSSSSSSSSSGANAAEEIGVRVKAKVVKNKVAPPYRTAEFVIAFNKGISEADSLLDAAIMLRVVTVKGSHYYFGEQRLGQGKDSVSRMLEADEGLRQQLLARVRAAMQEAPVPADAAADDDDAHGVLEREEVEREEAGS